MRSTGRARGPGQSLVELALVAPIVIMLAMLAWDGGSVLREQVVLQQAARDGARVAATAYTPGAPQSLVTDAVRQHLQVASSDDARLVIASHVARVDVKASEITITLLDAGFAQDQEPLGSDAAERDAPNGGNEIILSVPGARQQLNGTAKSSERIVLCALTSVPFVPKPAPDW